MIESILVGTVLAAGYGFCVQRWADRSSKSESPASQGRMFVAAFLRLLVIAALFFILSKIAVLDIAVVMLAFIVGVSFFLFFLARSGVLSARVKASELHSQGR